MRKFAILSAAFALIALGCDEQAPTDPVRDMNQPTLAQGGANPGPYTATEVPVMPGTEECYVSDITDDGSLIASCTTYVCCGPECDWDFI